jgi:chloramphenicol 3-O phosphotransferase
MDGDGPSGHLIGLNGGSSAGKTTLGRKLQSSLDGRWLLLGIDAVIWMLPAEMVGDADGIQVVEGEVRRGAGFLRLYSGFQHAVADMVRHGIDVILDDVLVDGADDQNRWNTVLGDLPVCWVGVHCDPETASMRERVRGDRPAGGARRQATSVHVGVHYDVELDTVVSGVAEAVHQVADLVERRWSISSTPATDAPPELPVTSAWNPDSTRRPAPWER